MAWCVAAGLAQLARRSPVIRHSSFAIQRSPQANDQ